MVVARRLRVPGLEQRLVLARRHEPDLRREPHAGRRVQQTDAVAWRAPLDTRAVHASGRDEAECEHQGLHIARELLAVVDQSRTVVGVAVGLEEPAQEGAVDLAVVAVQDRVGDVRSPALPVWPSNGRSFANPQASHQIVSGTECRATSV